MKVDLYKEDEGNRVVAVFPDLLDLAVKEDGVWKVPGELSAPLYGGMEGFSQVTGSDDAAKLINEAESFARSLTHRASHAS